MQMTKMVDLVQYLSIILFEPCFYVQLYERAFVDT